MLNEKPNLEEMVDLQKCRDYVCLSKNFQGTSPSKIERKISGVIYKKRREEATQNIHEQTKNIIFSLADFFEVSRPHSEALPKIFLIDKLYQYKIEEYITWCNMDLDPTPFPYMRNAVGYFIGDGSEIPYHEQNGPVIILNLSFVDHERIMINAIAEESIHYLFGTSHPKSPKKKNVEDLFCGSIFSECAAYVTRSLFGLTEKEIISKPGQKTVDEWMELVEYLQSVEVLLREGTENFFGAVPKKIEEKLGLLWRRPSDLDEVVSEINHGLGYELGKRISHMGEEEISRFYSIVFSNKSDKEKLQQTLLLIKREKDQP